MSSGPSVQIIRAAGNGINAGWPFARTYVQPDNAAAVCLHHDRRNGSATPITLADVHVAQANAATGNIVPNTDVWLPSRARQRL
jgi:hypothetical protein